MYDFKSWMTHKFTRPVRGELWTIIKQPFPLNRPSHLDTIGTEINLPLPSTLEQNTYNLNGPFMNSLYYVNHITFKETVKSSNINNVFFTPF